MFLTQLVEDVGGIKIVSNVFIENINSVPNAITSMFLTQLVEDIGGIKASVVAELPGDHLKGLGHGANDQLLLATDGAAVVSEILAQLHVNSSSSQDNCAGSGFWTTIEVVEQVSPKLQPHRR